MFKVNYKDTNQNDAKVNKHNYVNNVLVSLLTLASFFEHIWTYFTPCSSVSIANIQQVNAGWESAEIHESSVQNDVRSSQIFTLTVSTISYQ